MLRTSYDELHADALALACMAATEIAADGRITPEEEADALALLRGYGTRSFEAEHICAQRRRAVQELRRGPGERVPDPRLARTLAELHDKAPRGDNPHGA